MGDLNYLRIAQILGAKLNRTPRPRFGGFSALATASNQFRLWGDGEEETSISPALYPEIAAAFEKVREGYEVDRVLVDPTLRKGFIDECHRRGVTAHERDIFKRLQAFRKSESSGITLEKTTRRADIDVNRVSYAAELGFRQLNFISTVSVDDVLTDPLVGSQFDELCAAIAPSGTSMAFRWAALRLRKTRCLSREKVNALLNIRPSVIEMKLTEQVGLSSLKIDRIPEDRGIFSFTEKGGKNPYLYIGSAKSLREGIDPFQGGKPFRLAAGEFWKPNPDNITLHYGIVNKPWMGASARELGFRLIRDRHPLFNMPVDFERSEAA